jgi:peptidoglycan/xylan/chitin deacetylase (PgdA/CDA1 family)
MKRVPVLLTCDIHTHNYSGDQVRQDLVEAREALRQLGAPATFFFPVASAELLRDQLDPLRDDGHEIGGHGVTHEPGEDYSRLPDEEQLRLLELATGRLTALLGEPPVSFRAPAFKVSAATLRALEKLGYRADLSVNSQKLGLFGSDIYSFGPLFAPRRPYHPSPASAFRKGRSGVLEIPVSAALLPFLSNTERLLGLPFMRLFFRALYWESRATGKPVVFVFHAEDFNGGRAMDRLGWPSWRHFLPTRTYGLEVRYFLFEWNWQNVRRDMMALVRYMQGFPGVELSTVRQYLDRSRATSPGPVAQRPGRGAGAPGRPLSPL